MAMQLDRLRQWGTDADTFALGEPMAGGRLALRTRADGLDLTLTPAASDPRLRLTCRLPLPPEAAELTPFGPAGVAGTPLAVESTAAEAEEEQEAEAFEAMWAAVSPLAGVAAAVAELRAGTLDCRLEGSGPDEAFVIEVVIWEDGLTRHALNAAVLEIARAHRSLTGRLDSLLGRVGQAAEFEQALLADTDYERPPELPGAGPFAAGRPIETEPPSEPAEATAPAPPQVDLAGPAAAAPATTGSAPPAPGISQVATPATGSGQETPPPTAPAGAAPAAGDRAAESATCSGCGAPVGEREVFCRTCGLRIVRQPAPAPSATAAVPAPNATAAAPIPAASVAAPAPAASVAAPVEPRVERRCPNPACQRPVPAGRRFCTACGTRVA